MRENTMSDNKLQAKITFYNYKTQIHQGNLVCFSYLSILQHRTEAVLKKMQYQTQVTVKPKQLSQKANDQELKSHRNKYLKILLL